VAAVAPKRDGVTRGLAFLKWGLVPSWANDATGGYKPTNARSDSLHKPTFRAAFGSKRCLIPADGFYEWKAEGKKKLPVHFRMTDGGVFGMAGLWEVWTDGTRTVPANSHRPSGVNASPRIPTTRPRRHSHSATNDRCQVRVIRSARRSKSVTPAGAETSVSQSRRHTPGRSRPRRCPAGRPPPRTSGRGGV
jgi:hypothetical protein